MPLVFVFCFVACSSLPLKKIKVESPRDVELSIIPGNFNVERYKTLSKIKVYQKTENEKNLIEDKIELSHFDLNRQALTVSNKGHVQFRYWVNELKGDVDLASMGLPPLGQVLVEIVDKKARVQAVQNFPMDTVFYLPKIVLPEKAIQVGDTWSFSGQWKSLKTGWPFSLDLQLKLEAWFLCGGLECLYITYNGKMGLPEKGPLEGKAKLKSKVRGAFIYAPVGHQFIWAESTSQENFQTAEKYVEVESCTVSYQSSPDKEASFFKKKLKASCEM